MSLRKRIKSIESRWDSADKWLKRIISTIGSLVIIIGAVVGSFNWGLSQINSQIIEIVEQQFSPLSTEVREIKEQINESTNNTKLSTTRLELNTLITHSPTNVLEIEKVAKYYFVELGGDWYMSQIYSDWAREYGGNLTFVTHK